MVKRSHQHKKRHSRSFRFNYTSNNDIGNSNITDRFISTIQDNNKVGYYHNPLNKSRTVNNSLRDDHNDTTLVQEALVNENSNIDSSFILRDNSFLVGTNFSAITSPQQRLRSIDRNLDDDHQNGFIDESISEDQESLQSSKGSQKQLKDSVAKALGLKLTYRILNFKPLRLPSLKKYKLLNQENILLGQDVASQKRLTMRPSPNTFNTSVDFTVLDAPGLRNDFYSNIVSWSKKANQLAVGLGTITYYWSEGKDTIPMQSIDQEIVSSISYSDEDILAVGTKTGRIIIYSPGSNIIDFTAILKESTGICCICWVPGTTYFFAGDDLGDVSLYQVIESNPEYPQLYAVLCKVFKCNKQQICGIDVSPDCKQITVGGNDNCCTIWDISDIENPILKFYLPHDAAVKAIAYCPWMPNLLATGGGSNDRHIRFWHTGTGTLINKHLTKNQITSLIWSRSKKELLATFGFGDLSDIESASIITVYSYPSMKIQTQIPSDQNLRILSAEISKDYKSICTAVSDMSVRIYSIWKGKFVLKNGEYDGGLYGSELLDLQEGVMDTSFESIR